MESAYGYKRSKKISGYMSYMLCECVFSVNVTALIADLVVVGTLKLVVGRKRPKLTTSMT